MAPTEELPVSVLLHRALTTAAKVDDLPTIDDVTQELIQSSLTDLRTVQSRVAALSLFSPNETLQDISTRDMIYLFTPFVLAEVQGRVRTTDREQRLQLISQAEAYMRSFVTILDNYRIVPESEKELHAKPASSVIDAANRRELKIKQYQKEKEMRARIDSVRTRRFQSVASNGTSDFGMIASLLPDPAKAATAPSEEDDVDTEEMLRETTLLLLRLTYAQAHAQLESLRQELALLRSAPPVPPSLASITVDPRQQRESEDHVWRLDAPRPSGGPDGRGPLLNSSGKPLRPFTILPSGAADRAKVQAGVFGPDHRLPTMSIDEYLEIEQERGNILSGGGQQSEQQPTSKEQLALDAEMDGTVLGQEKAEERRQRDEAWAQYTDTHPKGAGNTMNRG